MATRAGMGTVRLTAEKSFPTKDTTLHEGNPAAETLVILRREVPALLLLMPVVVEKSSDAEADLDCVDSWIRDG